MIDLKSKIEFARVLNGQLSVEQREKLNTFCVHYNGKEIHISYEVIDRALYYQHKYYRGFLLLDVSEACGERDLEYVHEKILKRQFLYFDIYDISQIPKYHRKDVQIYLSSDNVVVGYVPSTGVLTFEEMKTYILKVENFLFMDLCQCINPEHQIEAKKIRDAWSKET